MRAGSVTVIGVKKKGIAEPSAVDSVAFRSR